MVQSLQAPLTIRISNLDCVARDRILLVHRNIPSVLISSMLGCLPFAAAAWSNGLRLETVIWIAALYFVCALRAIHYARFNSSSASIKQMFVYRKANFFFVVLAGLAWGMAGPLFFDSNEVTIYAFLILTLVGIISGSMNALSSLPPAYPIFSTLTMGPTVILMVSQGSSLFYLMGGAIVIYLIMTIIFSRNLNRAIDQSLMLKYENQGLVENLKQQTAVAEKANHDKSRFLATASHDLRQPLHAVNLFSESLENSKLDQSQRTILNRMRRGLDSMSELFDALLDISQIDANKMPLQKSNIHLQSIIGNLIRSLSLENLGSDLVFDYSNCDHIVCSDPVALERIIENLLSNAIRYTERGKVELFCVKGLDQNLKLHIRDTGIGIKAENFEQIFEEFVQLDNPERDRSKGIGLGLAIVQRLCKSLDHSISLKSVVDEGSEFILNLPLGDCVEDASANENVDDVLSDLEGLSVLVIDNEEEIVEGMRILLERWGCVVSTATSTQEAFDLFSSSFKPEFIISDYRMPGKFNGIEFIRRVRKEESSVLCIMITGDTTDLIAKRAIENDIVLIYKPIRSVQLHMAITQILANRSNVNSNSDTEQIH